MSGNQPPLASAPAPVQGGASTRHRSAFRRPRGLGLSIVSTIVGIWLILPPLVIVPMSLTSIASFRFPPPDWSLKWYESLITTPRWREAFITSFEIAVIVAVVATLLGTAAALGLKRGRPALSGAISNVVIAPLIIPTVVAAVGIYFLALQLGIQGTIPGFIAAHVGIALPFVFIAVLASLESYDDRLDWAAATLGAGRAATFRQVTLPLIRTGVAAGALFAFIASFDETVIALFLVGPRLHTLPVTMYEGIIEIIDPTVAAASSVLFGLSIIALFAGLRTTYRRAAT